MSLRDRIRNRLAELLPRWLAVALRIRRLSPDGYYWPWRSVHVEPIADSGGGFRAAWRPQDPSKDPREPNGGESSSTGNDHGWSNCTMASGALGLAYQQPRGSKAPWGGDLRHRQSDLSGGTDLVDCRTAWSSYGETLTIKSGAGWSAVKTAHNEGRAIVIQGSGNVPGSESFDGGHACCIAPETHSDGRWLWGDPLADGWQWVKPSDIETWAERWQSSVAFAVGEKPPPPPVEPTPVPPEPVPVPTPQGPPPPQWPPPDIGAELRRAEGYAASMALDQLTAEWVAYMRLPGPIAGALWDDAAGWAAAVWGLSRGPLPDPPAAARAAIASEREWNNGAWRADLWH